MPSALQRACLNPSCEAGAHVGPCPLQAKKQEQARGSSHARGYTRRWASFRAWWIRKLITLFDMAPVCGSRWPGAPETDDSRCAAEGRLNDVDMELDHIVPFMRPDGSLDEQKQFDVRNIQALCVSCHARKTATKDSGFARRTA